VNSPPVNSPPVSKWQLSVTPAPTLGRIYNRRNEMVAVGQ